jgi:hypothetical protein
MRLSARVALAAQIPIAAAVLSIAVWPASAATAHGGGDHAGRWGKAAPIPGLAALNSGGDTQVFALSCPAKGDCAAGGNYKDRSHHTQAFVASETNGHWGRAIEVPGTAALNSGGGATVVSVACAAPGNCAAGGDYQDHSGHFHALVVTESKGRWGKPIELPGLTALNAGRNSYITSVSCAASGDCVVAGYYTDRSLRTQALVASETKGRWGKAIEVPGTAGLNAGGQAIVYSVSCSAPGDCAAGGEYTDKSHRTQALVASETKGRWGKAIEVPGSAALNAGGQAVINSISCPARGDCAAGGGYTDKSGHSQALVASESNGHWSKATEVPGTAPLNAGGSAYVSSISCGAPRDCAGGGPYTNGLGRQQAFVVSESKGRWSKAIEVPGTAALNVGENAYVNSISCAGPGDCAAGGLYSDGFGHGQAFVADEAAGHWAKAIEVPGTSVLNAGDLAFVSSVSCPEPGHCVLGGGYTQASGDLQSFVASQS